MPELDDHRNQPHSLPSPIAFSGRSPSFTVNSASPRHPSLTILASELAKLSRTASRESNEQAIVDEDDMPPVSFIIDGGRPATERRTSVVPPRGRTESSAGRIGRQYTRTVSSRSSSRSPSPPNSVDAFADPERRRMERSGTVSSQAPTELLLQLRRTASRHAMFDDADESCLPKSGAASQISNDDVCFPMPDEKKNNGQIDFEEMEEFVAEQRAMRLKESMNVDSYFDKSKINQSTVENGQSETSAHDYATTLDEKRPLPMEKDNNRFTYFCSDMDSTIHAPEIGDLLCEGETFRELFRNGDGVWWLDCYNATEAEQKMLMKAFSIHPLTAEDIRVQETREKVELFKSYYFTCFRSFIQDKESEEFMEPVNVYIVVFREGVLSFHNKPSPHSNNVRKRIRQLKDYVALSSDWICYALIDDITDSFGPVIHAIENETDAIEDAVFVARTDDHTAMLRQVGDCRKKVMGLMRLLGGKADVIKGFAKRCNEQYSVTPRGEIGLYLGDIQGEIIYQGWPFNIF